MTSAHWRYLRAEAAVGAVVNAILSLAFVLLVFGGRSAVPVTGSGGIVADALPQAFMVALMSCLVPTVLTRRRLGRGVVTPRTGYSLRPRHAVLRAAIVAVPIAIAAWAVQSAVLPAFGSAWSFRALLAFKCAVGASLGASISALAVWWALSED